MLGIIILIWFSLGKDMCFSCGGNQCFTMSMIYCSSITEYACIVWRYLNQPHLTTSDQTLHHETISTGDGNKETQIWTYLHTHTQTHTHTRTHWKIQYHIDVYSTKREGLTHTADILLNNPVRLNSRITCCSIIFIISTSHDRLLHFKHCLFIWRCVISKCC